MSTAVSRRAAGTAAFLAWAAAFLAWVAAPWLGAQELSLAVRGDVVEVALSPQDASPESGVRLSLEGEVYEGGLVLEEPEPETSAGAAERPPMPPVGRFLIEYYQAWREGTHDDVKAFWSADGLGRTERHLAAETFEPQSNFYKKAEKSRLFARLHYAGYLICVVQHAGPALEPRVEVHAIEPVGSEYFLTSALYSDPVLNLWRTFLGERVASELAAREPPQ